MNISVIFYILCDGCPVCLSVYRCAADKLSTHFEWSALAKRNRFYPLFHQNAEANEYLRQAHTDTRRNTIASATAIIFLLFFFSIKLRRYLIYRYWRPLMGKKSLIKIIFSIHWTFISDLTVNFLVYRFSKYSVTKMVMMKRNRQISTTYLILH